MILVGNGRVITGDQTQPYFDNGCVAIKDNIIVRVGNLHELKNLYPEAKFIDAGHKVIMPGLINTHMHLYSTFARGMALKGELRDFPEILHNLWWKLDKTLTMDDIFYSALIPLLDCIKNGTTTIFDHHASPGAVQGSLFTIEKAVRQVGVRSCLCYEVSDRDGLDIAQQGITENEDFIRDCKGAGDNLVQGMFGLHASFTLGQKTLELCSESAKKLGAGFHVHTAEAKADLEDCLDRYGRRVVERFNEASILGPKTIAAHCVHIDEQEMNLLINSGTKVVHNPQSNMSNGVGCAPVIDMLRLGVTVGLGTDGYTCEMFESFKTANILHKHQLANPQVGWVEAPAMLFQNNSEICTEQFGQLVGLLTPGATADLIIVDYDPPTPMHAENLAMHILFGMSGGMVSTTIIDGKIIMRDRELLGVDEGEIRAKARELAAKLWQRF